MQAPLVGVIMGSRSDWETMKHAVETLESFGIHTEAKALSAHRTPDEVAEWASTAEERGMEVIIAAAGGAAHLAGVVAAHTVLPVLFRSWATSTLTSDRPFGRTGLGERSRFWKAPTQDADKKHRYPSPYLALVAILVVVNRPPPTHPSRGRFFIFSCILRTGVLHFAIREERRWRGLPHGAPC